jgi:hypothetical protein
MDDAACNGMVPRRSKGVRPSGDDVIPEEKDIFFPIRGENKNPGKTVCLGCPVRQECKDYSIKTGSKVGMWGAEMKQKGKG